ncbi:MAG: flagellar assembly protein FliW [Myxococcota bacterium]
MTAEPIRIDHAALGEILATEDEILGFPGLPGFPEARRFVVRQHDRDSVFGWLVCLELPDLAFPVTDPWSFVPDYAPPFGPHHWRAVDHREGDPVQVLAIARLVDGAVDLNLAAPVLIDLRSRRGLQAILETDRYACRTRVLEAGAEVVRSNRSPRETEATEAPARDRSAPPE